MVYSWHFAELGMLPPASWVFPVLTGFSADGTLRTRTTITPSKPVQRASKDVAMSSDSSFDPEFFQKLLESAFAVQESGVNARSLVCIVEIQRSIKAGHLDVDGTMRLIAEFAQQVAGASGVAVGRLKGDQLVYGAGSGSAASSVGRCVMATFIASAPNRTRAEILRVENAESDPRIEAAICRQFGATSLLILPIYHADAVAGVMQVLFGEAHAFQEDEVRIYRLLAGLVGEAMSQTTQLEQKRDLSSSLALQPVADLMPAPIREPLRQDSPAGTSERRARDTQSAPVDETSAIPRTEQSPQIAFLSEIPFTMWTRVTRAIRTMRIGRLARQQRYAPLHGSLLKSGLVVVGVLTGVSWIFYRERPSAMFSAVPVAPATSSSVEARPTFASTAPLATNSVSKNSEPRDVAQDVMTRPLTRRFPKRFESEGQVLHFGDDVTVRYFTPKSFPVRTALRESEVRHVSEDVTVRYYRPKNVGAVDGQAVGSGGAPAVIR